MENQLDAGLIASIGSHSSRKILVGRQQQEKTEPSIEVEKDGEQVTKIVVRCSCGEEVIVHCNYPKSA